jgi:Domain of unknown function DUF11
MKKSFILLAFIFTTLVPKVQAADNVVPVTIDSDPQGVTFSFTVPNRGFSISGTTPARINDVPVGKAFVHFETIEGCTAPKPQNRTMGQDTMLNFFGRYTCGNSVEEPTVTIQKPVTPTKHISARVSPSQLEALPGSTVQFTVAVHNDGAAIDTPVTVRYSFDAGQMSVASMPNNARMVGSSVEWVLPNLAADATWSSTVSMKLASNITVSNVHAHVSASANGVTTAKASTALGTPSLPKTGFGIDGMFAIATALLGLATVRRRFIA